MKLRGTIVSFIVKSAIVCVWAAIFVALLYIVSSERQTEESIHVRTGRIVRILAWGDIFDPVYIRAFEEKMGVTVHLSSYTSNEELLVKLKASKGKGYDLIMPSDYAVALLIKEGLIKKLDDRRHHLLEVVNPLLKQHPFDPHNEYSIPYEWEVYGIAYDKAFFVNKTLDHSWSVLFENPRGKYRIIVSGDSREMVRAAAHYLYGPIDQLTGLQQNEVEDLLRAQREWVEAYTLTNLDFYLTSGFGQLAFASSAYVGRRKHFASRIGFFVPREGGLVTIENMALPIHGENEDLVYAFMEFILSSDSMIHHFNKYTYFPARQDAVTSSMTSRVASEIQKLLYMSAEEFNKLIFIKHLMPEEQANDLWVRVKA